MASLYFYYSSMNAGKTTTLLQSAYNYEERKMRPLILKPRIDTREGGDAFVRSRIGLSMPAVLFNQDDDLLALVDDYVTHSSGIHVVLVDEAQFLTEQQVTQLCTLADFHRLPVLCYGLRTDFQGKLFPGSAALLAHAEKLREIKGICSCGTKSTHVLRLDDEGQPVFLGDQVVVGGNDRYEAVCRRCHSVALRKHVQSLKEAVRNENRSD